MGFDPFLAANPHFSMHHCTLNNVTNCVMLILLLIISVRHCIYLYNERVLCARSV